MEIDNRAGSDPGLRNQGNACKPLCFLNIRWISKGPVEGRKSVGEAGLGRPEVNWAVAVMPVDIRVVQKIKMN